MQILYDYQAFSMQSFGGISRYFSCLSTSLPSYGINTDLKMLHSENGYLTGHQVLPYSIGHFFLKKKSRMERWNRRYTQLFLNKNNFDVFHPTYYDPYFLSYVQKPYVITVHDMIHEIFPEYFYPHDPTSRNKRRVIEGAEHIIAISNHTKHDLQRIYAVPDSKISVIHHGFFDKIFDQEGHHAINSTQKPYVLYVGDRETYKNFYRFSEALSHVMAKYPELELICAGGGGLSVKEQEHLKRLGIVNSVRQMTVNDRELRGLYKNALFFCYPSLYEGFGLPILEAFANACPVLISNTSCFKEIGGQAALYFDPYNIEEMEHVFTSVIEDNDLREPLIDEGRRRLMLFSSEACIEKTIACYKNLI